MKIYIMTDLEGISGVSSSSYISAANNRPDLIAEARKSGDWSEVQRWKRVYDQKGTTEGQALQARRQFAGTTTELVSEAAANLEGERAQKLKPDKKAELMDVVYL